MAPRSQLHDKLKTFCPNVYHQPPANITMNYPCIKYSRTNIRSSAADNSPYKLENEYTITVIDADPDSVIPDNVAKLPRCIYDRGYAADGLNHNVFQILF